MVYASNLNDQKNITWLTDEDKFWFGKTCGIIFPKQFSTLWKNFQSKSLSLDINALVILKRFIL